MKLSVILWGFFPQKINVGRDMVVFNVMLGFRRVSVVLCCCF